MTESASPRQVLERLLDGIAQRRWHELHELYTPDAVIEYPFALPAPMRLVGREAIRAYFAGVARHPLELRARNVVMHEAREPEVIVVQWDYDGLVTTTGRSFQVSNIQISTVRNGQIVMSHDYHNHAALAAAVGGLNALVAALGSTAAGDGGTGGPRPR
jgi:ketosteroid isomerase-like protein